MWMYVWFGLAMLEAVVILWLVVMVLRARARHSALAVLSSSWKGSLDSVHAQLHGLRPQWADARVALRKIAAQETPKANSTVKRMARIAREALS